MTDPNPDASEDAPAPVGSPPIGVGPILTAIGGVAYLISSWFPWLGSINGSETGSAYDAPARFLVDVHADLGGPSVGVVVLVMGVVMSIGAVVRGLGLVSLAGGVVGLLVVALFSFQMNRLVEDLNELPAFDVSLTDVLDLGVYVAAAGAALAIIGGALSIRRE